MANMYAVKGEDLQAIGDAIRTKRGMVTPIEVKDMPFEISLIDGGSGGDKILTGEVDSTGTASLYIPEDIDVSNIKIISLVCVSDYEEQVAVAVASICARDLPITGYANIGAWLEKRTASSTVTGISGASAITKAPGGVNVASRLTTYKWAIGKWQYVIVTN